MFEYLSIGAVSVMLGVSITTLRRWHKSDKLIPSYITYGGHRRYKRHDIIVVIDPSSVDKQRHSVVYSRVSSHDQKKDLVRQEQVLLDYANEHNLSNILSITDLGSGMNYKKKGLTKLIGLIVANKVDKIYVTNRDRLLRFGFELVESIARQFNTTIVVLNEVEQSFEQTLAKDELEIITVFSARLYGSRSHKNKKKQAQIG
jgi:predicted site-specific integrase-resolvase